METTALQTVPDPLVIIQQLAEKGMAVSDLQALVELKREMERDIAAKKYAEAIHGFQLECPTVFKAREVKDRSGKLMYTFANYDDIKRVTRPLERKYGITVSFTITRTDGRMDGSMRIRVGNYYEDKSGSMSVPKGMNTNAAQDDIQATTYFKRNLYVVGLDIVISDDQDNDGAGLYQKITPAQIEIINTLIEKCHAAGNPIDFPKFLDWFQIGSLDELPAEKFEHVTADLTRKMKGTKK